MHSWSTRIRARYVLLYAFTMTIAMIGWMIEMSAFFATQ